MINRKREEGRRGGGKVEVEIKGEGEG